jgi:hypothetical protein
VCVVVYCNGMLTHVRWAVLTPLALPELNFTWLHLDPTEAYMYGAYTFPAFRHHDHAARARNCLVKYLAHRGITSIYRMTQTNNPYIQSVVKQPHDGRQRTLGIIRVTTLLGSTRCTFFSTNNVHRLVMARLFNLSTTTVNVIPHAHYTS